MVPVSSDAEEVSVETVVVSVVVSAEETVVSDSVLLSLTVVSLEEVSVSGAEVVVSVSVVSVVSAGVVVVVSGLSLSYSYTRVTELYVVVMSVPLAASFSEDAHQLCSSAEVSLQKPAIVVDFSSTTMVY